jgi:hypothetical protein
MSENSRFNLLYRKHQYKCVNYAGKLPDCPRSANLLNAHNSLIISILQFVSQDRQAHESPRGLRDYAIDLHLIAAVFHAVFGQV